LLPKSLKCPFAASAIIQSWCGATDQGRSCDGTHLQEVNSRTNVTLWWFVDFIPAATPPSAGSFPKAVFARLAERWRLTTVPFMLKIPIPLSNRKAGIRPKEDLLKNISKIIALFVGALACVVGAQPTGVTVQGEAQTSNLSQTTTLGSANIRLKIARGPEIKLQCGILGLLQGQNMDGSLRFQETVACDDRSIFTLNTRTVISPSGACANGQGIVGTFHEDSVLTGIAGPYLGATGQLSINGTIDCGFNKLSIEGSFTPAS
jgi:hypothetical protein